MIDNINSNPYRILGLWSNSPAKEKVAHLSQLKAFLKVGRAVPFPQDLPLLLPALTRTQEQVDAAESQLTRPQDQLRHAQFWLLKSTPMDEIALNHLTSGNIDTALSIWEKRDTASSLQNRIICALIRDDYTTAISCAEKLYTTYLDDFVTALLGPNHVATTDALDTYFLDTLCETAKANDLIQHIGLEDWKTYIFEQTAGPLLASLQTAVETAKSTRGKGPQARLKAGQKLKTETQTDLRLLLQMIGSADLRYQMIADKVGIEMLQCGIDYYNGADDMYAAYDALEVQSTAYEIVVGAQAKARCKENVDILKKTIATLPPKSVQKEAQTIRVILQKYGGELSIPTIEDAIALQKKSEPYLQSIRTKIGKEHSAYLALSTSVVAIALGKTIREVNLLQSTLPLTDKEAAFERMKPVIEKAWKAMLLMDSFDMDPDFRSECYIPNRKKLGELLNQISTEETKKLIRKFFLWGILCMILSVFVLAILS